MVAIKHGSKNVFVKEYFNLKKKKPLTKEKYQKKTRKRIKFTQTSFKNTNLG